MKKCVALIATVVLCLNFAACSTPGGAGASPSGQTMPEQGNASQTQIAVPTAEQQEILNAAEELVGNIAAAYAEGGAEAAYVYYQDCETQAMNESIVWIGGLSAVYEHNQFRYVAHGEEYDIVSLCSYITTDEYPNEVNGYDADLLCLAKTDDGYRIVMPAEEERTEVWLSSMNASGDFAAAYRAGRLTCTFRPLNLTYDLGQVMEGTRLRDVAMFYQNEDGSLVVGIYLGNGTDEPWIIQEFDIAVHDNMGNYFCESSVDVDIEVPAGGARYELVEIPADEVNVPETMGAQVFASVSCW